MMHGLTLLRLSDNFVRLGKRFCPENEASLAGPLELEEGLRPLGDLYISTFGVHVPFCGGTTVIIGIGEPRPPAPFLGRGDV